MDTSLDQPDSVTTFDARGQDQTAFMSLVYDLSNEEVVPVEQNRIICLERLSSLWQKSHFRDPPAETFPISGTSLPPHWVGKVADYHQLSASFNNSITNSQSGGKNFCELCQFQLLPDVQFSQSPTRAQPWFREPKKWYWTQGAQ